MYIGRDVDNISNVEKLDNITFDGSATYALTKSSVAYTPSGANNILISIDGVVQMGNFSTSTSNIVFDWSPTSSNTCDWILHYGTGLITTPADSSVTASKLGSLAVTGAKLNTDVISAQTELAVAPADADEFMVSDGGVLKRIDYSLIKGGDNTPAFLARVNSDTSVSDNVLTKVEFDTEEFDTDSCYDNTTNYRFTVPAGGNGKYFFYSSIMCNGTGSTELSDAYCYYYKNGGTVSQARYYTPTNRIYKTSVFHSLVLDLVATDYVEMYVNINSYSGTQHYDGYELRTYFGGYKLL